jgi:hypothetical protein
MYKIFKYHTPVARLLVRQAHAQKLCFKHALFCGWVNLAYLVFACLFAKTNGLNYWDSKTAFSSR